METLLDSPVSRRVAVELLKNTKTGESASLKAVSSQARCSLEIPRTLLRSLGVRISEGQAYLSTLDRLNLAISLARAGSVFEAGRFLGWQEFEKFAEQCLLEMGYETNRNVRVKGEGRSWQVDLVGAQGGLVVCIDCKHWATHSSPSRFKSAREHQAKATRFVLKMVQQGDKPLTGLPVILTLFDPPRMANDEAVTVPVQRLPSFLSELTQFSPGLPFIVADEEANEKPYQTNQRVQGRA